MSSSASTGLLASLRRLGDNLLATVHDRIELVAVELQEEKLRLVQTFIWISTAVFTGMMALVFVSLTIVYLFWDQWRLGVLITFAVVYSLIFVAVVLAFRRHLAREPRPLDATLKEMAEDRSCIPPES
jgi:uncharacterized membrane protein YqjE